MRIRHANVLGVLVVVAMAVSITLGVGVYISNRALEEVKDHQDKSVADCFADGLVSVVDNSKLLLMEKGQILIEKVRVALHETQRSHKIQTLALQAVQSSVASDSTSYGHIPPIMHAIWKTNSVPLIGWLHVAGIGMVINYHPAYNREALGVREENASLLMLADEDTVVTGATRRGTVKNGWFREDIPCLDPGFSTYDGTATGECPFAFNLSGNAVLNRALSQPIGATFWTQPLGFDTWAGLVLMSVYSSFDFPTSKQALSFTGFQLGTFNVSADDDERNAVISDDGTLIGASHGPTTQPTSGPDPLTGDLITVMQPIPANDSFTDPVISNLTAMLYALGGFDAAIKREQDNGGAETLLIPNINEEWYITVQQVEDDGGTGLVWWAVSSVRKESILRGLMERQTQSEKEVSDSNDAVRSTLQRDTRILFGVTVAASLILVGAAWYATKWMLDPLEVLKRDMGEVAEMNFLGAIEDRENSYFEEINSMQGSFLQMLSSLKELRQYMPQAIVDLRAQDFDDEDISDDSTDEERSNPDTEASAADRGISASSSDPSGGSSRILSGVEFHREGTGYVESLPDTEGISVTKSDVFDSIKASPVAAMLQKNSGSGLKKKTFSSVHLTRKRGIAQVCLMCRDFEEFVKKVGDTSVVIDFHTRFLQCIVADAKDLGGTLERFVADAADVNFGGLVPCTQSAVKAANYALKVRERLSISNLAQDGFDSVETEMACGVAAGVALVGNLGVQGLKTPSILGRTVFICKAMTTISREMGLDIVVDQRFADEVKGTFKYVPIDILRLSDNGKKQAAHHLMNTRHATTGEWMYTLESGSESPYEKVWRQFKTMVEKGGSLLQVIEAMNGVEDPVAKVVACRLKGYHDEVLASTGKPSMEYSRVYKPKGLTVCAPEAVRKVSTRLMKSSAGNTSRGGLAHQKNSDSMLSHHLSSSGNLITPGTNGSFGMRSNRSEYSPNARSPGSDVVVSPRTTGSPSVTSILVDENFPSLPSSSAASDGGKTPNTPSIKRLR